MTTDTKKFKLLHFSHLYPTESAPFLGSFMYEMHKALSKEIEVHFIVPTPKSVPFSKRWYKSRSSLLHPLAKRIFYYSFPKRKFPAFTKRNLLRAIDNQTKLTEYHLLHLNWTYPEPLLLPEIKQKLNIPILITLHGYMYYDVWENPTLRPYLHEALNEVDRILAVGNKLKKDIGTHFPSLQHKIFHLPNGVDENKFFIKDTAKSRSSLGWSTERTQVLCVSNIAKEKGTDILVDAIAESNVLKKVDFHIVGRTIDARVLKNIRANMKLRNLNNIHLHGPVAHAELPDYYAAADAFVLPSRSEGFGIVLVEAGMSGLPLVSTKSGGPEEIILPENGLLSEVNDALSLSEALEQVVMNLDNFSADKIRASMVNRYSQEPITQTLISHYNELLK